MSISVETVDMTPEMKELYKKTYGVNKIFNSGIVRRQLNCPLYITTLLRHSILDETPMPAFSCQECKISEEYTEKYLGCSLENYKLYLESLFTSEMSWSNYGRKGGYWEIDHIRPTTSFDLTKEEEIKAAFHYLNTQPLPISENRSKSNK